MTALYKNLMFYQMLHKQLKSTRVAMESYGKVNSILVRPRIVVMIPSGIILVPKWVGDYPELHIDPNKT